MENDYQYFLPTKIVCKILNVCPRTLQNYRTDGKIKFYKLSRSKVMYRVEDVVEFVKKSSCASLRKDMLNSLLEKYAYSFIQLS
ncbi:MAG: hypothetical protein RL662_230 [Bacteroidota bacterium]|jgi:predicted site-specific integrase-resolvase